ncbi:MAG: aldo/keto reductase [Anaerolineae bacterium]
MGLTGRATPEGTARYAARFVAAGRAADGHYRTACGLTLSSIGYGTQSGDPTEGVDALYQLTVAEAVRHGCNVLDTASSYRAQRSELALGRALAELVGDGHLRRDEVVVMSKGGFISYYLTAPDDPVQYIYEHLIRPGIAEPDELAGGIHCMAPNFLSQQIAFSLRNTRLRTIDVYFIQNPETQLAFVDRTTFRRRLQLAFARLEEEVASGRIGCYGIATWEALRRPPMAADYMSLENVVRLAVEVAGADHHLRAVQLPLSVVMSEAATLRNQPVRNSLLTALGAAQELGLLVFASAALGQGLPTNRPIELLAEAFPQAPAGMQRVLQFARSLPGVTTALFGSLQPAHVRDILQLAGRPPAPRRALQVAQALAR